MIDKRETMEVVHVTPGLTGILEGDGDTIEDVGVEILRIYTPEGDTTPREALVRVIGDYPIAGIEVLCAWSRVHAVA